MVIGRLPAWGYFGKQMYCYLKEGSSLCLARRNAPVPTPGVISRSWLPAGATMAQRLELFFWDSIQRQPRREQLQFPMHPVTGFSIALRLKSAGVPER